MPVTEFVVLSLTKPVTSDSPTLPETVIQHLKEAKAVLESASGYGFRYFQQVEDPSKVYILGLWDSVTAHTTFIASPENQRLLELLKDEIFFTGERKITLWHLEGDVFALDPSSGLKSVFTAPVISCNRHFVSTDRRVEFVTKFQEVRSILEDYTKPFNVVGGWRIEKEEVEGKEREELVLFSGFDSVDNHMVFAETEPFTKYREIVALVQGFDLNHFTAIEELL